MRFSTIDMLELSFNVDEIDQDWLTANASTVETGPDENSWEYLFKTSETQISAESNVFQDNYNLSSLETNDSLNEVQSFIPPNSTLEMSQSNSDSNDMEISLTSDSCDSQDSLNVMDLLLYSDDDFLTNSEQPVDLLWTDSEIKCIMGDTFNANKFEDDTKNEKQETIVIPHSIEFNLSTEMGVNMKITLKNDLRPTTCLYHRKKPKTGSFVCLHCGKTFQLKQNLNRHSRIHEGAPIKCTQCYKILKNQNEFYRHRREIHGKIECSKCQYKCKDIKQLKDHKFCLQCPIEGCTFVTQDIEKFKMHQYWCWGFIQCDLCFRRFKKDRLFPYKRHLREQHKTTLNDGFYCQDPH